MVRKSITSERILQILEDNYQRALDFNELHSLLRERGFKTDEKNLEEKLKHLIEQEKVIQFSDGKYCMNEWYYNYDSAF